MEILQFSKDYLIQMKLVLKLIRVILILKVKILLTLEDILITALRME
nr:MAG TPA: hypothetical protein [Caudoviricetes sp.]